MDRRSTKSLWRDYGVPMQDPNAFSLQYYKDTSRDPNKPAKPPKKSPKKVDYTDHTGLLKIQKPKKAQDGLKTNLFRTDKTAYVDSTLNANKNIEWVKRLTQENTPYIKTPKEIRGSRKDTSTHLMSDDGKGYVYPQVVDRGKGLEYLGNEAEDYARKTSTGIQFPQEQGSWFAANGYKQGTNVLKKNQGGKMIGLLKKGGKVGDPKNRKKAGGSNVGKYSKSEGPFAGPSGGAPTGSYPIGSKSRGKSALKLAHNAPNPGGIKAAVYRKYPDLKPGKALHGAKLGLMGMGRMQDKAPTPFKANAPADKVDKNFKFTKKKRKEPKTAFAH